MERVPYKVLVHRDMRVQMPDGVVLLADRYVPVGAGRVPTVLVRSPYGRRGMFGLAYGRAFARHGFQVILQSCRGGFGSGGVATPLDEQDDGLATIEWMRAQPWYGGSFALHGPSYLGHAHWGIAPYAGPELKAMATQVTASQLRDAAYVGGSFALEATLSWSTLTAMMNGPLSGAAVFFAPRRTRRAVSSDRPVGEFDVLAAGRRLPFFQEVLTHHADPDAPFWKKRDHSGTVGEVDAAVTMTGGWYDVFLPWQLRDYAAMRRAGRRPHLTIGPWHHADVRHGRLATLDALAWFRAHLLGDPSGLRESPVRVYVTGADEWRDYDDWPVPGTRERRWHLQGEHGLGPDGPAEAEPDRFRFDPADPTPVMGGPTLLGNSAPRDNRRVERRPDVLVYTSPVLHEDLDAIGPVTAELYVRTSTGHADLVVRVCDVHPDGTSLNVCEGVRRLAPGAPAADEDGVRRAEVELWPIAHRFRRGHRVRVQVAGGAYPRLARNLGTGEPLATGRDSVPVDEEVFHDPAHPSALVLRHLNG
ncbi:CocE/NonD family hydrolase [Sphaerisporangium sp. B11E5]|uniref:CocE/NonD family hydrolase n=1 Tax=Sphaerisporangium sp. B11E5 TaxID=3153563 RepID=UPI00325DD90E